MRIAAIDVEDRSRFGGITTDGPRVTGFVEKGARDKGLINAGLYRIHRSAFDRYAPSQAFSLESDVMPRLAAFAALSAARIDGRFIDIGVPEDYFRFCREHGASP